MTKFTASLVVFLSGLVSTSAFSCSSPDEQLVDYRSAVGRSFELKWRDYKVKFRDDYFNQCTTESEVVWLDVNNTVVDRIRIQLPSTVAPHDWNIDDQGRVYILSNDWCTVSGCPRTMHSYVTSVSLTTRQVIQSRNLEKAWALEPLIGVLSKSVVVTYGRVDDRTSEQYGKFVLLDKNTLREKVNRRLNHRPLVLRTGVNTFAVGYYVVDIYDEEGRSQARLDEFMFNVKQPGLNDNGIRGFYEFGPNDDLFVPTDLTVVNRKTGAYRVPNTMKIIRLNRNGRLVRTSSTIEASLPHVDHVLSISADGVVQLWAPRCTTSYYADCVGYSFRSDVELKTWVSKRR